MERKRPLVVVSSHRGDAEDAQRADELVLFAGLSEEVERLCGMSLGSFEVSLAPRDHPRCGQQLAP